MEFEDTINEIEAHKGYSIFVIKFDKEEYKLSDLVRIIENNNCKIKSVTVSNTNTSINKIALFYIYNNNISDAVIDIKEAECIEIIGINKKTG